MNDAPMRAFATATWKCPFCCLVLVALFTVTAEADADPRSATPATQLGKKLFGDNRFTNPACNTPASCDSCHRPASAPGGIRAYADSQRYSLIPTHLGGSQKRATLRNTPSLMGLGSHTRFNHDGRTASLEETILAEITSVHFGWSASGREDALDEIHYVLLNDEGRDSPLSGSYVEQFRRAYAVNLAVLPRDKVLRHMVRCLADYVRGLQSSRTSAYDAFLKLNALPPCPRDHQSPQAYGNAFLDQMTRLEEQGKLRYSRGFRAEAAEGLKIFLRTSGNSHVGNCVMCHVPPGFTDGKFHNTGITQMEFDGNHGAGAFFKLSIPDASTSQRPLARFLPRRQAGQPVHADLGYWNYVRPGVDGSDNSVMAAALAAFKTPTLRNLAFSDPYMHNGSCRTLREAVAQKMTAASWSRWATLRNGAPALRSVRVSAEDIPLLTAFLATLNDRPVK